MSKSKITIVFLVLNIVLLFLSFYFVKNGTFSSLDSIITSKYVQLSKNEEVPGANNIALVKIDSKFFNKMGVTTWTFHRGYYAELQKKLNSYGVKTIAYDVFFGKLVLSKSSSKAQRYFNKTIEYFNDKLINALSGNTVLGVIPGNNGVILPSNNYLSKGVWLGYVDSHMNKDQINDGVIPYSNYKNIKIPTLGLATYLNMLYQNGAITKKIDIKLEKAKNFVFPWLVFGVDKLIIKTSNPKIHFEIPLSKDLNNKDFWFVKMQLPMVPNSYSLYDILANKIDYPDSVFDSKVVFVGATDQALNDIKTSYQGLIPGVMFHINSFLNVLSGEFAYLLPIGQIYLIIFVLFLLGFVFVELIQNQKKSFLAFAVISVVLLASSFYLYNTYGLVLPVGTLLVVLLLKLLLDILHVLAVNQSERSKLIGLFTKYVGGNVLKKKENSSGNLAEKKEIALMFSDIASFTNISEMLTPSEVITMLNIYFEKANTPLSKTGVQIDKYIGDAIMAFWENVNYTDKIADAVITFQKIHSVINKAIYDKIGKKIEIKTRVGLHFGEAILGDLGDENTKINYTAIGDNVNLASRLEGINKYYGTRTIMSEYFYNKILNKKDFAIRLLDKITVKGKTEPVKIYELMTYRKDELTDELKKYISDFSLGLKAYFDGDFESAKKIFIDISSSYFGKNDNTLKIFIERVEYLLNNKPDTWDGVWRFSTK